MHGVQPFARSGPYTSGVARTIGEATKGLPPSLQLSPAQIDHLLQGYFNTWATYGTTLADAIGNPNKPTQRLDQMPVLRRFYSQEPARNTRYVTELHDAIAAAMEARQTMRLEMHRGDQGTTADLAHSPENLGYRQMTFADQRLQGITKQERALYSADTLAEVQKFADYRAQLTKAPDLVAKAKQAGAWNSIGGLKRFLLDGLVRERNEFARNVMENVHQRAAATGTR
jgi:hypothetical protein